MRVWEDCYDTPDELATMLNDLSKRLVLAGRYDDAILAMLAADCIWDLAEKIEENAE